MKSNLKYLVVVLAALAACSTTPAEEETTLLDPAEVLGAGQYAVKVSLEGQPESGPASGQSQWAGRVEEVVWSAGTAWTGGKRKAVSTPDPGELLAFAGSDALRLDGLNTVVVIVREIEYQGSPLALALMILDQDWLPVPGTDPALVDGVAAGVEKSSAAGGRDGIESLLEEAVAFNDQRNIDPNSARPGPLVEAARSAAGLADESQISVDSWLARPPEGRQLSSEREDIPDGADRELKTTWAWREAAIVPTKELVAKYQWVGIFFTGVGVLGPVHLNPAGEPTVVAGWGPDDGEVQIVAWTGSEAIPGAHDVLTTVPNWTSSAADEEPSAVWFESAADGGEPKLLNRREYDARLERTAADSGSGDEIQGQETDNPDPDDTVDR